MVGTERFTGAGNQGRAGKIINLTLMIYKRLAVMPPKKESFPDKIRKNRCFYRTDSGEYPVFLLP
jgi:hypothetical protein